MHSVARQRLFHPYIGCDRHIENPPPGWGSRDDHTACATEAYGCRRWNGGIAECGWRRVDRPADKFLAETVFARRVIAV